MFTFPPHVPPCPPSSPFLTCPPPSVDPLPVFTFPLPASSISTLPNLFPFTNWSYLTYLYLSSTCAFLSSIFTFPHLPCPSLVDPLPVFTIPPHVFASCVYLFASCSYLFSIFPHLWTPLIHPTLPVFTCSSHVHTISVLNLSSAVNTFNLFHLTCVYLFFTCAYHICPCLHCHTCILLTYMSSLPLTSSPPFI